MLTQITLMIAQAHLVRGETDKAYVALRQALRFAYREQHPGKNRILAALNYTRRIP